MSETVSIEERFVRNVEATLARYDADKERPAPAWLQRHIDAMRAALEAYRRDHPREVEPTPSITCPHCGRTSYHPKDIGNNFCGVCGFWGDRP